MLEKLRKAGILLDAGEVFHLDGAVPVLDGIFDQFLAVAVVDRVSEIGDLVLRFVHIRDPRLRSVPDAALAAVRRLLLQGALACLQLLCKRRDLASLNTERPVIAERTCVKRDALPQVYAQNLVRVQPVLLR